MHRRSSSLALALVASVIACDSGPSAEGDTAIASAALTTPDTSAAGASACYRSTSSVLLGPSQGGESEGHAPGWLRIDVLAADSGMARLTDANGAGLGATWRRVGGDSIVLAGFDDFLRLDARLRLSPGSVNGTANAHSDAALERDSAGRLQELRRSWTFYAMRAPCEQMPAQGSDRNGAAPVAVNPGATLSTPV